MLWQSLKLRSAVTYVDKGLAQFNWQQQFNSLTVSVSLTVSIWEFNWEQR